MSTTIITRMYSGESAANAVAKELRAIEFPDSVFDVVSKGDDVAGRMAAAGVADAEAAVYGPMIGNGNALVVVRAPFTPFGAVRAAKEVVDAGSPMAVDVENANRYMGDDLQTTLKSSKIRHGYWGDFLFPLISTRSPAKDKTIRHGFWGNFLVPHLSARVPSKSNTIRHGFWGDFLVPHLSKRVPSRDNTIRHGFWGAFIIPHLIHKDPSVSKENARFPYSNSFGIPMLSRR